MNYLMIVFAICLLGDPLTCVGTIAAKEFIESKAHTPPEVRAGYLDCMTKAFALAKTIDVGLKAMGLEAYPVPSMTCRSIGSA